MRAYDHPIPEGTRCVHTVFTDFRGPVGSFRHGIYVLILDEDIGHFKPEILVQANEIAIESDWEIDKAAERLRWAELDLADAEERFSLAKADVAQKVAARAACRSELRKFDPNHTSLH